MSDTTSAIMLTPDQLQDGQIPSGHKMVSLSVSNANFVEVIYLPEKPRQLDVVQINLNNTGPEIIQIESRLLKSQSWSSPGQKQFIFTYDDGVWGISGSDITQRTPKDGRIPNYPGLYTNYVLYDKDWIQKIILPAKANDNDQIMIKSQAGSVATVDRTNVLYDSTIRIRRDDLYIFKFLGSFGKWALWHSPTRKPKLARELARPIAPRTQYTLTEANWIPEIKLPQQAGDRDRIIIKSNASQSTRILPAKIINPAAMTLRSGAEYEFLYVKEKNGWFMVQFPDTNHRPKGLKSGNVPPLTRPRTIVSLSVGNFYSTITLPKKQPKGSRVVVKNDAGKSTDVLFRGIRNTVEKGEIVAFKVNNKGVWVRETITIDLLLLYSDKAAEALGKDAMKQRLEQELQLTNEALESSGANFRFRSKAIRQIPAKRKWNATQLEDCLAGDDTGEPDLGQTLCLLSGDDLVMEWLNELAVDGVFYEGTETTPGFCGVGNYSDDGRMIVGVSSVVQQNCTLGVMAHELGHGMGLNHPGETTIRGKPYGVGYPALRTIMESGYDLMVYSTPHRYDLIFGIPLGIPNKIDAVRAMNEVAAARAAYRSNDESVS